MTATIQAPPARRRPEVLRWVFCFALALGFHAAGAAALFARWGEDSDLVANAPVITVAPVMPVLAPPSPAAGNGTGRGTGDGVGPGDGGRRR